MFDTLPSELMQLILGYASGGVLPGDPPYSHLSFPAHLRDARIFASARRKPRVKKGVGMFWGSERTISYNFSTFSLGDVLTDPALSMSWYDLSTRWGIGGDFIVLKDHTLGPKMLETMIARATEAQCLLNATIDVVQRMGSTCRTLRNLVLPYWTLLYTALAPLSILLDSGEARHGCVTEVVPPRWCQLQILRCRYRPRHRANAIIAVCSLSTLKRRPDVEQERCAYVTGRGRHADHALLHTRLIRKLPRSCRFGRVFDGATGANEVPPMGELAWISSIGGRRPAMAQLTLANVDALLEDRARIERVNRTFACEQYDIRVAAPATAEGRRS